MIQKFIQRLLLAFFLMLIATLAYSQKIETELGSYTLLIPHPKKVAIKIPQPFELTSKQIPPFDEYEHVIPKDWSFPSFFVGAEDYFFKSLKFYEKEDWKQSLANFEKTIAESGEEEEITQASLYWVGRIWFAQNQLTRARDYFKQAVSQSIETNYAARSAYAISWILLKRRKFSHAIKAIEEYQKYFQKPEFIERILYLKAYAYMSQKKIMKKLSRFLKTFNNNFQDRLILFQ